MNRLLSVALIDLFAGICVSEVAPGRSWYERLLGSGLSFFAHEKECVWEIGDHRFVYVVEDSKRDGHAVMTLFAGDLDAVVEGIASRGLEPALRETYSNGVRKVTYRDPDGNEIGYGGPPAD